MDRNGALCTNLTGRDALVAISEDVALRYLVSTELPLDSHDKTYRKEVEEAQNEDEDSCCDDYAPKSKT